jgi:hypothetical protein
MTAKGKRSLLLLIMTLTLVALACGFGGDSGPPRNAAVIEVKANSALTPWLTEAAAEFNRSRERTSGGQTAYVVLEDAEAGRAVNQMMDSGVSLRSGFLTARYGLICWPPKGSPPSRATAAAWPKARW